MYHFIIALLLFSTNTVIAGELNKDYSFDLGIGFSPTFAPEAGYKNTNIRLGIEYGISFYKYQDSATFKIKGVTQPPRTTFLC